MLHTGTRMKLETEFIKLPLLFDVDRLAYEVGQFAESEWMGHTTGFAGNSSIPLIALDGEFNDALHGPMKPTPALQRCPYIQQIMTDFDEVFSRSRLMRLAPGSRVPPHADVNYHWHNRVRIHIPVTTTAGVLFYCAERHVHMAAGECWIFDSWSEHRVENTSDLTRVHLVLDTAGSPRFWDLAERGGWPFSEDPRPGAAPRQVAFDPTRPVAVRTETYNAPPVQSPAELENLIRYLVDDIDRSSAEAAEALARFFGFGKRFVRSWREVWAAHAMQPDGWPLYHALVRQAQREVTAAAAGLTLKSNGVDLAPAFGGLVLFSAINEEFAPLYLGQGNLPDHLQPAARHFANRPGTGGGKPGAPPPQPASAAPDDSRTQPGGRNRPCDCGSGKRYKHCCGRFDPLAT